MLYSSAIVEYVISGSASRLSVRNVGTFELWNGQSFWLYSTLRNWDHACAKLRCWGICWIQSRNVYRWDNSYELRCVCSRKNYFVWRALRGIWKGKLYSDGNRMLYRPSSLITKEFLLFFFYCRLCYRRNIEIMLELEWLGYIPLGVALIFKMLFPRFEFEFLFWWRSAFSLPTRLWQKMLIWFFLAFRCCERLALDHKSSS